MKPDTTPFFNKITHDNNVENIIKHVVDIFKESGKLDIKSVEDILQDQYLFNFFLENTTEHIYFKDTNSRFIKVSRSMLLRFGIESYQDIIGKTDFDIQDEIHAKEAFDDEQEIVKSGNPLINKIEKEIIDGEVRWVTSSKLPLKNSDGEIIGIFGISRDISNLVKLKEELALRNEELMAMDEELRQNIEEITVVQEEVSAQKEKLAIQNEKIKQQNKELEYHKNHLEQLVKERTKQYIEAQEKAKESDKLKTSFLANMSHEIRTPMNAIIGFSQLLKEEEIKLSEDGLLFVNQIIRNADTLMLFINNILDMSLIEVGQLKINKKMFYLNKFMDDLFISTKQKILNPDVNLEINNRAIDHNIIIDSDERKLKTVLVNILDNAIKFTHQGCIRISVSVTKNSCLISVSDTGIGISDNDMLHIFELFRKSDEKISELYRGAGLGLAVANSLTKKLGGTLTVKTEPNKGSVFSLLIPIS